MAAGPEEPVLVDADAPDAVVALTSAVADAGAVLVRQGGIELAAGAPARLVALLRDPHCRLVRVHTDGSGCYLARSGLLALALDHGVPALRLLADPPGLDRDLARAADIVDLDGPTPIEDPASGRWRQWVDGAVVGVRAAGDAGRAAGDAGRAAGDSDPGWAARIARGHRVGARVAGSLRRRAGRARREVVRLRQRPRRGHPQR